MLDWLEKEQQKHNMMHLKQFGVEASIKDIEENSPLKHEATFKIPAQLKYLDGHFPNNPVLPAFASIELSLALGRDLKLITETVKKISNAKFLAVVKPNDTVKIFIRLYASSVDFEWQVQDANEWKKSCEVSVDI